MPNEPAARLPAPPPDDTAEHDYQALLSTLSASARGRAFLAEYLRRNRGSDTEMLIGAIDRLAALVRTALAPAEASTNESTEPAGAALRPHLVVVPQSKQTEPPTPAPGDLQRPPVTLSDTAESLPEVTPLSAPPGAAPAAVEPASQSVEPGAPATAAHVSASADPLKAIMALSEEERIALFM